MRLSRISLAAEPLLLMVLVALVVSCSSSDTQQAMRQVVPDSMVLRPRLPDTLKVGVLYSPTGYFLFRGDTLGYDYERVTDFAADHRIALKFEVAESMKQLLTLIDDDKVDLLAVEIPETAEYKEHVINCGAPNITYQVLVQPAGGKVITDVTQLVGRDVYVIQGSQYEARLKNLDSEIGGGINIRPIDNDTIIAENLIDMVASGKLPMTVVDSDIAQFGATYYEDGVIDISLKVSFAQRSSWGVAKEDRWLADTINAWAESDRAREFSKEAKRRYFELNKSMTDTAKYELKEGDISPYDSLFNAYARKAHCDWMLLAAICKVESGFDNERTSWAGAKGIMQVMPRTAKAFGYDAADLNDPEKCIDAAAQVLSGLDESLRSRVPNVKERQHFILAAYNCGLGHIVDAMALAKKYGYNPQVWYGNVEEMALWKSRPEYYNDPVCKFGYFRARETVGYVKKVEESYEEYLAQAKKEAQKHKNSRHRRKR